MEEKNDMTTTKRRAWAVACLAAVVAAMTGYLLIRPALTREAICGIQEHVHTDLCYTQMPEARTHTHTEDCCDAEGNLVCEIPETPELPLTCTVADPDHVHGPRCYGTWALSCGVEEHVHTESCYSVEEPEETMPSEETAGASEEAVAAPSETEASPDEAETVPDGTDAPPEDAPDPEAEDAAA